MGTLTLVQEENLLEIIYTTTVMEDTALWEIIREDVCMVVFGVEVLLFVKEVSHPNNVFYCLPYGEEFIGI